MKKIVLDTKRSQVIFADDVRQEGDSLIATFSGKSRTIQMDKVAYIEDANHVAKQQYVPEDNKIGQHAQPPPPQPIISASPTQIKLPSSFADAVERRLREAPPPDPFDDTPTKDSSSRVMVELIGSASGSYEVMTDSDSLNAEHVKERLVSDIFSNASLKESLRSHNVVGIVKKGNLVTLDCRQKPPVSPPAVSASVTSLVNNIVGLVTPSVKLPDIPMQGLNEDTKK